MSDHPTTSSKTPLLVGIAADHGGYELKEYPVGKLRGAGHAVVDFGDIKSRPNDDYPGGWFTARPSGTEDIYKIYAESFKGTDHLRRILKEPQTIVNGGIAPATPLTTARPKTQ